MGFSGYLEKKLLAIELRKKGLSYGEIIEKVVVSKDTVSRWCKDIQLTDEQQNRLLLLKQKGQSKGSAVAANNKRIIRKQKLTEVLKEGRNTVGLLSDRDFFIAGIALYAAEGDKGDGRGGFANSDPQIITFMMQWFLRFLSIPISRYRGAIWIHEGLDQSKAKKYWSELTTIPESQFHKTYISKNKPESKKIRKNIHSFGVFSIRFSDSASHRMIISWISALVAGKIPEFLK